ncbi:MAG: alanine racemase, partial [Candidatus Binataceae bacterium]
MEMVSGPLSVAEIDLAALGANYQAIKSAGRGAELMAVVKADAYGHGAIEVTHALRGEGCGHFGVARVCEARELRAAGVRERIYLLGGFLAGEAEEIVGLDVTPFVYDAALVAPLGRAAEAQARASFLIHLKIDSGATRLGILPGELDQAIAEFGRARSLTVEGLCTL